MGPLMVGQTGTMKVVWSDTHLAGRMALHWVGWKGGKKVLPKEMRKELQSVDLMEEPMGWTSVVKRVGNWGQKKER